MVSSHTTDLRTELLVEGGPLAAHTLKNNNKTKQKKHKTDS